MDVVYEKVNDAWKKTCKVVLGQEVGDLEDYADYLSEYSFGIWSITSTKSVVSGKDVLFATKPIYASGNNSRAISQDELATFKPPTIDLDAVKDIDSLVEEIKSNFAFVGNTVFGNTSNIADSTLVYDSSFCYKTHNTRWSKFVAYSSYVRSSNYVFGSLTQQASFAIRCAPGEDNQRAFETCYSFKCSDSYFVWDCWNCRDVMFSFGKKNKTYMIGNREFNKDEYLKIKAHLLEQICDELKEKKRFFSFGELVCTNESDKSAQSRQCPWTTDEKLLSPVDQAYRKTQKLLFGQEVGTLKEHRDYLFSKLNRCNAAPLKVKGKDDEPTIIIRTVPVVEDPSKIDATRFATRPIFEKHNETNVCEKFDSVDDVIEWVRETAVLTEDVSVGNCRAIADIALKENASYFVWGGVVIRSQYGAVSYACVDCTHTFGSICMFKSSFTLRGNDSTNCKMCYEIDSCVNCSTSYYCYNCEGCTDLLFCFNLKGKRRHVANTPATPDQYNRIKEMLRTYIIDQLKEQGDVDLTVYDCA